MYLRAGLRLFIGLVFLAAAVMKAWNVQVLAVTVQLVLAPIPIANRTALMFLAIVVIASEGVLGWSLLLGLKPRFVLAATVITLVIFTGVLIRLLLAHEPTCPCLGKINVFHGLVASAPLGIGRNCILREAIRKPV
jgi:hypothetical protein